MTQEQLKQKLSYDPDTGIFTWLHGKYKGKTAGTIAGVLPDQGYIRIVINKTEYKAHRLVWLYTFGYFPKYQIDHKDHDRTNNKLNNLVEATASTNSKNQSIYKNNKSGFHGVTAHGNKWRARININGVKHHIGIFDTIEEAAKARRKVELENNFSITHGNYKSLTTIP